MRSRADAVPSQLVLPAIPELGAELELPAEEAHHAVRVCRVRAGERVQATDGNGVRALLEMIELRGAARARVVSRTSEPRTRDATVLCGAPEGQRADWLVEKLGELGIGRLVLIDSERAPWSAAESRLERLGRLAVAALRQSRRAWRVSIEGPTPLPDALAGLGGPAQRWLAEEGGAAPARPASEGLSVGAIGPAAGFSSAERGSFEACGFRAMSLSDGRLRTETAALAWAAWWSGGW